MRFFLIASAVPLYLAAIIGVMAAKSDIQIIVAVLGFGFATNAVGLAGVIARLSGPKPG